MRAYRESFRDYQLEKDPAAGAMTMRRNGLANDAERSYHLMASGVELSMAILDLGEEATVEPKKRATKQANHKGEEWFASEPPTKRGEWP